MILFLTSKINLLANLSNCIDLQTECSPAFFRAASLRLWLCRLRLSASLRSLHFILYFTSNVPMFAHFWKGTTAPWAKGRNSFFLSLWIFLSFPFYLSFSSVLPFSASFSNSHASQILCKYRFPCLFVERPPFTKRSFSILEKANNCNAKIDFNRNIQIKN